MMTHFSADVAVIGAGPVGCVTALAHAHAGAQVLLLEANPQAAQRLAGEWLHPAGVEILKRVGMESIPKRREYPVGRGFVVFPEDSTAPIVLDYPVGSVGESFEHHALVSALRQTASTHPNIRLLLQTRATALDGQRLSIENRELGQTSTVLAERIVGADGRSSIMRKWLGLPQDELRISRMAGLVLEDVDLPFEGYGHLVLGAPGPMLIYRISSRYIRVCLDVPPQYAMKGNAALWDAYGRIMPEKLRPAFQRVVRDGSLAWATIPFRPRHRYGHDGLALVGDAVGHVHPLTAVGMILGFGDGECLARSASIKAYQRERAARSHVPELLAVALYEVFARQDNGASALRQAIYHMWRRDQAACSSTMCLLSGQETRTISFSRAFLNVLIIAVDQLLRDVVYRHAWHASSRMLAHHVAWLRWEIATALGHAPITLPPVVD